MTRTELVQHIHSEIAAVEEAFPAPASSVDLSALDHAVAMSNLSPCSESQRSEPIALAAQLLGG